MDRVRQLIILMKHNNLMVNRLAILHISFQRSVRLKAVSTMVLALHLDIFMRAQVDGSCVLVRVDFLVGDVKTVRTVTIQSYTICIKTMC